MNDLTPWERDRNAKILAALDEQRREFEADPSKARAFLMGLGCWNEDGTLKDDDPYELKTAPLPANPSHVALQENGSGRMTWNDDSWKDSYDSWKLASPDDDRDDYCDHDDYDVDILEGRARCNRCPESWYVSEEEVLRQIEHERAYNEHLEAENRKQWWRDLFAPARNFITRLRKMLWRREPISDDDIPF